MSVIFQRLPDPMLTLVTSSIAPVKTELFSRATFTTAVLLSTNMSPDRVTLPSAVRLATLCPCAVVRISTPFPGFTTVSSFSNIVTFALSSR